MSDPDLAAVRELPCIELVELATTYLDDALDTPTRAAFEAHMAECEACCDYLDQIRATIALARRGDRGEPVSEDVRSTLLDLFRRELGSA